MLSGSRRNKGNQFEYNVEYSLKTCYPDIRALERRGFARGYDLISNEYKVAIECKFHQSIVWNELLKIYHTIEKRAENNFACVVFKTNRQPVLVFNGSSIVPFESYFGVPFKIRPKGYKEEKNDNSSRMG